jgi:hypothetical protein
MIHGNIDILISTAHVHTQFIYCCRLKSSIKENDLLTLYMVIFSAHEHLFPHPRRVLVLQIWTFLHFGKLATTFIPSLVKWFDWTIFISFHSIFSFSSLLPRYSHYNKNDIQQRQKTVAICNKTVAYMFRQRFLRRGIYGRCLKVWATVF